MQICISINLCYLYTHIYNFFKYIYIQWVCGEAWGSVFLLSSRVGLMLLAG